MRIDPSPLGIVSVSFAMSTRHSASAFFSQENKGPLRRDDLMLGIPEPANVKTIVSEFALTVSDSRRGVTFMEIHCLNSVISMLHTSASFLIIFTVRIII